MSDTDNEQAEKAGLLPGLGGGIIALIERFETDAESAKGKEYLVDLTEGEACAIAFFAGVPYVLDSSKITFMPFGLFKRNGQWTAVSNHRNAP